MHYVFCFKFLFIWLHQVLISVRKIFSCGIPDPSSLTKDGTPGPLHWKFVGISHCTIGKFLFIMFHMYEQGPSHRKKNGYRKTEIEDAKIWSSSLPTFTPELTTCLLIAPPAQGFFQGHIFMLRDQLGIV